MSNHPKQSYNDFLHTISTLTGKDLNQALVSALEECTGAYYGDYSLPDNLLTVDFVWNWYRYVRWRYEAFGERVHHYTWIETLRMLSEEPSIDDATLCIKKSIRNHWKGIFPNAKRADTYIAVHTSRAERDPSKNGGYVIDTVRRRKPTSRKTPPQGSKEASL